MTSNRDDTWDPRTGAAGSASPSVTPKNHIKHLKHQTPNKREIGKKKLVLLYRKHYGF